MKKVALIISPPFWLKTPHIGLEYIKRFNESEDVQIHIFDLNMLFFNLSNSSNREWLKLDKEFEDNLYSHICHNFGKEISSLKEQLKYYDYIGFSIFKRNENFSLEFISELKKTYNGHLILGGPQTREYYFNKDIFKDTSIVVGEGEIPWHKIIYQDKKGTFLFDEIKDLDEIPFLKFDGFDMTYYKPVIPLLSSRGCIRRCLFCSECTLYQKFRRHSVDYILRQIETLKDRYKIKHFSFQDSLFNSDLNWLKEFCINVREFDITWEAQMIIREDMDEEILPLIRESGAMNLFIGFESGSDSVLNAMKKGFNISSAKSFFERLTKFGINFEISIIVGYPAETEEDFKQTLNFIRENKKIIPRIAQISSFTLYNDSALSKDIFQNKVKSLEPEVIYKRLRKIINFIEKKKIPHKKAFLDNLSYLK